MEQLAIYLWAISVNIQSFCFNCGGAFTVIGAISFFVFYAFFLGDLKSFVESMTKDQYGEGLIKWFNFNKFLLIIGIPLVLIGNLIPSQRDLALIFTYPYIKSGVIMAVKSPQMKKMNDVSLLYLDKITNDLQKEIKEHK